MRLHTQNKREAGRSARARTSRRIFEMVLFAMLGSLMFCSKIVLEVFPNIHLLGMLTVVYTIVFRYKALIPLYIYVFLNGIFCGFATWWVPYLYIWTILWGVVMLLPRQMSGPGACVVYALVCALHGLFFGVLYAPFQALVFGLGWQGMLTWIANGFVFDMLHFSGNIAGGMFIVPLAELLGRLQRKYLPR